MNAARKKSSGEHPAVKEYRTRMKSLQEGTLPLVKSFNQRLRAAKQKFSPSKPRDERREDEGDTLVDVITFPEEEKSPT